MCFEVVSMDVVNCVRFCNVSTSLAMNNEVLWRFSDDKFDCPVCFDVYHCDIYLFLMLG